MKHPTTTAEFELGRQARQRFEAGQLEAAREALQSLAKDVPDNAYVRIDLAAVLHASGRLKDSTEQLLQAAGMAAPDPRLLIQLARRLLAEGETAAARTCLEALEILPHSTTDQLAEQAHLRWMMKDVAAARRMIDRAIAAGADRPRDHHLHAMLLQFTGELDAARDVLDTCLRRWPGFGDAALARANLRRHGDGTDRIDASRDQLARLPSSNQTPGHLANRATFEAALFKELDDLGRYDEAWQALARCNMLMHQVKPYDGAAETALVDALIEVSGSLERRREPDQAPDGPQPIFIVGMPRSGTTLLDRMLSSHPDIESAGEITDFARQLRWLANVPSAGTRSTLHAVERSTQIDLAELGERYLTQVRWRAQGRRWFVDKLPTNIRMVAHIRKALPQARILHLSRDPMDVCFSNLSVMFGSASAYSYDQAALAHYYGEYARLTRHWRDATPDAMLELSYADLTKAPESTLRRVLDYCGLEFEEACLHPERNSTPVATPSSIQVRGPVHGRAFGAWRHYAAHLGVLQEAVSRAVDARDG